MMKRLWVSWVSGDQRSGRQTRHFMSLSGTNLHRLACFANIRRERECSSRRTGGVASYGFAKKQGQIYTIKKKSVAGVHFSLKGFQGRQ